MYRLMLYYLIALILLAVILSFFHLISFDPINIVFSTLFLVLISGFANDFFSKVFHAPTNTESAYISALILTLIITPASSLHSFIFLALAGIITMASKYIFAIDKKHIFNPVAIAVILTAFGFNLSASWWVGNMHMLPAVIAGGMLVSRKIRREDMVFAFLSAALITIGFFGFTKGNNLFGLLNQVLLHSSLAFLAFVMLTEPLTTPPTKRLQIIYGALVGILFAPQINIAGMYSTPELALAAGNIFSYIVSPKEKLVLKLSQKIKAADDIFDFIFPLKNKLSFPPGQYMEWTLSHKNTDSRGNRRYFTIASSPTENNIRIGVKFYDPSSSYKKTLLSMDEKTPIIAASRAGDFTLTNNPGEKYVFMAGGIGITPFRSIIKYLIDTKKSCDIILMYSNKNASEIVYKDIFNQAQKELNIKVVYTLTDKENIPSFWQGNSGRIDEIMIKNEIPDYSKRLFYLSGPHNMVTAFEKTLKDIGIAKNRVRTDFFPGFV